METTISQYQNHNFRVDYIPNFLSSKKTNELFKELNAILPESTSRRSKTFGDDGLIYDVQFKNKSVSAFLNNEISENSLKFTICSH